jgi:hypothetical protein
MQERGFKWGRVPPFHASRLTRHVYEPRPIPSHCHPNRVIVASQPVANRGKQLVAWRFSQASQDGFFLVLSKPHLSNLIFSMTQTAISANCLEQTMKTTPTPTKTVPYSISILLCRFLRCATSIHYLSAVVNPPFRKRKRRTRRPFQSKR